MVVVHHVEDQVKDKKMEERGIRGRTLSVCAGGCGVGGGELNDQNLGLQGSCLPGSYF